MKTQIKYRSNNLKNVKEEWIAYLESRKWDFFVTGTTRYNLTLKSCRRLVERFFNMIKYPGDIIFWVAEPFELRDSHHFHGLLKHPTETRAEYMRLINMFQKATGARRLNIDCRGFDWDKTNWNALDLHKYDSKRGAGGYICKYLMKTETDYDLLLS